MKCDGVVLLEDDHWGSVAVRCDRDEEHEGPHRHRMGATDPPAMLVWNSKETNNE